MSFLPMKKKQFINKQIKLIEKKIKILKGELEKLESAKALEEQKLDALRTELEQEKERVKLNPELGFSFSAYYEANQGKQTELKNIITQVNIQINELKDILLKQNIELKKYEKLDEIELEREKEREEALTTKELDEFELRNSLNNVDTA